MLRLCPGSNENAQRTWIGISEGAQKIIYWLLNARNSGNESGEWALLDFQNKPTERLKMATKIEDCLQSDSSFFSNAKPVSSNITILLSPESSQTFERKGRANLNTMAAMGFYEALNEREISSGIDLEAWLYDDNSLSQSLSDELVQYSANQDTTV
jgi:beta-galactosidase